MDLSCSLSRAAAWLTDLLGRHYHPAPPGRVTMKAERTFEGISLDQPGFSSKQVTQLSRFQLCEDCYASEYAG